MLQKIIDIDDLVGVKYKEDGRDKNGYDCYGLAMEVSKRFGNELPELSDLTMPKEKSRDEVLSKIDEEEKKEANEEGDLILINDGNGIFSHIGVYLGDDRFIHCNIFGVHINKIREYKDKIGRVYGWQK